MYILVNECEDFLPNRLSCVLRRVWREGFANGHGEGSFLVSHSLFYGSFSVMRSLGTSESGRGGRTTRGGRRCALTGVMRSVVTGGGGRRDVTNAVSHGSIGWQTRAFLLQIQDGPVEHVIVLESLAIEEFLEESFEVGVIGTILETQTATVFKVRSEFRRIPLAQLFRAGAHLAIHDAFVLLFLGVGLEALPGQRTADKVHEDVAETLQIIASGLFDADVRVDGSVTGGAGEILVLAVGDVLMGARIAVLLGQSEVDNVNDGLTLAESDEEIIRFDVAMNEGLGVHVFEATDQLIREHQYRLELKSASAVIKQIFEGGSEQIQHHDIIVPFDTVPTDIGDSHCKHFKKKEHQAPDAV